MRKKPSELEVDFVRCRSTILNTGLLFPSRNPVSTGPDFPLRKTELLFEVLYVSYHAVVCVIRDHAVSRGNIVIPADSECDKLQVL